MICSISNEIMPKSRGLLSVIGITGHKAGKPTVKMTASENENPSVDYGVEIGTYLAL
jgi:hypothetical protein